MRIKTTSHIQLRFLIYPQLHSSANVAGRAPDIVSLLRKRRWTIMNSMSQDIVSSSPDILSGTPVFAGTRVPVQTFIDYLEAGESIDDFLDGFPTVSRQQVIAFLEEAKNRMTVAST
jgi:uncharacterized protein (DUF433 family)